MALKNLISVIIPVHNGEKYLMRAINSVLNQTYKNYEIIIIDDGSTDTSVKIAKKIKSKKIKIIEHKKNQGQWSALNTGIRNSSSNSDLISFLDCDDFWLPTYLEKVNMEFNKNKKIGLIYCNLINFHKWSLQGENVYSKALEQGFIASTSCMTVPKKCLIKVKYFSDSFEVDSEMCLKLAKFYPISLISESLVVSVDNFDGKHETDDKFKVAKGKSITIKKFKTDTIKKCGNLIYGDKLLMNSYSFIETKKINFFIIDFYEGMSFLIKSLNIKYIIKHLYLFLKSIAKLVLNLL